MCDHRKDYSVQRYDFIARFPTIIKPTSSSVPIDLFTVMDGINLKYELVSSFLNVVGIGPYTDHDIRPVGARVPLVAELSKSD